MKHTLQILFLLLFCSTLAKVASTQHEDHHNDVHHSHHNHLAVFIGNTFQIEHSSNAFTVGLDYMYFFPKSEHWGISAFGETIMADHTEWLLGIPAIYKFKKGFWLRGGPGIELAKDHHNDIEYYFLMRLGGGYDFHLKKLTLSPSIDFDGLRKHPALVFGLNVGFGF